MDIQNTLFNVNYEIRFIHINYNPPVLPDNSEWTIKWYHNADEIVESHTDDTDFVKTEYETDLLGAEKLFVAQLYFPHVAEFNQGSLAGNYTCELVSSLEPLMRKSIEIAF